MSLFVGLRLSGTLHETLTISETIDVDRIVWSMNRPSHIITIGNWVENLYSDDSVFINFSICLGEYIENQLGWPSDGDDDVIHFTLSATINVSKGYVHSSIIRFSEIDAHSIVYVETTKGATFSSNLKIEQFGLIGTSSHDAYVNSLHINEPNNALLTVRAYLVLTDEIAMDHQILATNEIHLFNGTAYWRINIPIQLEVIVDNNNFNTADPIQTSITYSRLYLGGYDADDFYKLNIPVLKTMYIKANATSSMQPEKPYYEIYVYDPSHTQKAYSSAKYYHDFEFVPTVTGDWFIKFNLTAGHGFYSFYVGTRETFYFRSDTTTVNGLSANKLLTSQSGTAGYNTRTDTDPEGAITREYWGIRVFKRSSSGVETEITNSQADPVARVYQSCTQH